MPSFNPMSYFSPTSVFSFLPSYLTATVPQPEPTQPPAETPEPKLERKESEESGDSLRTEEVSIYSAEIQAEHKADLNSQQSEVFLFSSFEFTNISKNNHDNDRLERFSLLKKNPRVIWKMQSQV